MYYPDPVEDYDGDNDFGIFDGDPDVEDTSIND